MIKYLEEFHFVERFLNKKKFSSIQERSNPKKPRLNSLIDFIPSF